MHVIGRAAVTVYILGQGVGETELLVSTLFCGQVTSTVPNRESRRSMNPTGNSGLSGMKKNAGFLFSKGFFWRANEMKVGDLVARKLYRGGEMTGIEARTAREQRERLGCGLVLSKHTAGNPAHPCVTVFYPKTGKIYDIAESLMEVLSAGPRR